MARDIDIVIESSASNSFRPFSTSGIDLTGYNRLVKVGNLSRKLVNIRAGSVGRRDSSDLSGNINSLAVEVDKAIGADMSRVGALVLYGTSNGSGQTLGLAKELQKRGAPRATYIGVGDLTLMPFGRQPPVPGIGDLQPFNAPRISAFRAINPFASLKSFGLPPNVDEDDFPKISDPGVQGDILENYYTRAGNRMRFYSQSPAGQNTWWWTSTQSFGEVHGEIDGGGWKNIVLTTTSDGSELARGPGSVDEGHHDSLCGQATQTMNFKAGDALRLFVAKQLGI